MHTMGASAQKPEDGTRSLASRVTDGCELPLGAENRTWVHLSSSYLLFSHVNLPYLMLAYISFHLVILTVYFNASLPSLLLFIETRSYIDQEWPRVHYIAEGRL